MNSVMKIIRRDMIDLSNSATEIPLFHVIICELPLRKPLKKT